jgi:conserved domain protein
MNEFEVVITETLQRKVKVQASSKREARRKVLDMYHYEEIVLNEKDFLIIQLKHYESNSRTNK